MRITKLKIFAALAMGVMASALPATQTPVDQADPSVVEEELRQDERAAPRPKPQVVIARPQAGATAVGESIIAGAVRIEGARVLPPRAFAHVIEKYVGRMLSPDDLRALASDVANVARDAGYGLATAWVPEQQVANGVLTVALDEGRVDAVEVKGSGANAVRHYFSGLASGQPIRTDILERQLLLAGDVPGIRMGKARLDRWDGRSVLTVGAEVQRVQARAYVDNWGSSTVGPVRARLSVDINGLLAEDDQLSIGGVVTPLAPKEFGLARLAYAKAIGTGGTELTFGGYVARSQPGGALADRDIEGRSFEVEAGVRHPFIRSRSGNLWGSLDFRVRDASQERENVKVRDDRLALVTASIFSTQQVPDGRVRTRLGLVQGVNAFNATRRGDPLASRADADGTFTKAEIWGEYDQRLGRGFSVFLQGEGQLASGPLLSSEEMGLGGRYFGRAWDYREYSGDRGIAGALELRFDLGGLPKPISDLQLYGYADAGKVSNYRGGAGGGSLVSAGGGIRMWFGSKLEADVEVGVPLTDGADPAAARDPRLSFTLGSRF
jgi:hemolysin activation/secretion protein